jgi:hypothetical protein
VVPETRASVGTDTPSVVLSDATAVYVAFDVAFEGKADIHLAARMSAFDPKRTQGPFSVICSHRREVPSWHYPTSRGTFAFLTGTVEAPRKEMKKIKGLKIHALKPGEKL